MQRQGPAGATAHDNKPKDFNSHNPSPPLKGPGIVERARKASHEQKKKLLKELKGYKYASAGTIRKVKALCSFTPSKRKKS